jgi:hypothetical protein
LNEPPAEEGVAKRLQRSIALMQFQALARHCRALKGRFATPSEAGGSDLARKQLLKPAPVEGGRAPFVHVRTAREPSPNEGWASLSAPCGSLAEPMESTAPGFSQGFRRLAQTRVSRLAEPREVTAPGFRQGCGFLAETRVSRLAEPREITAPGFRQGFEPPSNRLSPAVAPFGLSLARAPGALRYSDGGSTRPSRCRRPRLWGKNC